MGMTAAGIGSGLDLESLIMVSLDAMRVPQQARLDSQKQTLDVTLSAVGAVKSAMSTFQDILEKASSPTSFFPRMATVNGQLASTVVSDYRDDDNDDEDKLANYNGPFDIELNEDAANGSYDVEVHSVASGSRLNGSVEYASVNTVVSDVDTELTFAAGDKSFTVEVKAGTTLRDLRESINNSGDNFGVSVNMINTGSGNVLVFDSEVTGTDEHGNANNLSITNSGAADTKLDSLVSDLSVTKEASSAEISVNGIRAKSDTNTFDEIISGVTINVNSTTTVGSPAKLEISADEDAALANVNTFIKAYNNVIKEIDTYSKPEGVVQGADSGRKELSGDSMLRGLRHNMGRMVTYGYKDPDDPSKVSTLYALGIEMDADGNLTLNESKFKKVMNEDSARVYQVFGGEGGIKDTFSDFVDGYVRTGGILSYREQSTQNQLKDLTKAQLDLDERMAEHEKTLRAKYTAFDQTMGAMNSQLSYIMAQLG